MRKPLRPPHRFLDLEPRFGSQTNLGPCPGLPPTLCGMHWVSMGLSLLIYKMGAIMGSCVGELK